MNSIISAAIFKNAFAGLIKIFLATFTCFMIASCGTAPQVTMPQAGINASKINTLRGRSYKYYVTFLASSTSIKLPQTPRAKKISEIRMRFEDFARGIGNNNLAIWFAPPFSATEDQLSKGIHDNYSLKYSSGPYIIVSNTSPIDEKSSEKNAIILNLNSINEDRIYYVVDELQRQIRVNKIDDSDLQLSNNIEIVLSTIENIPEKISQYLGELLKDRLSKK